MTQLDEWLNQHRVPYTPYPQWQTRTSAGDFHPVGIMVHHTGDENSNIETLVHGHSTLPGPISHLYIERTPDLRCWLISDNGNCNHTGIGDIHALERVRQDKPPQYPPGSNTVYANQWFYGIEIEGNSEDDFTNHPKLYQLAVHATAAICLGQNWDPMTRVIAHKEWTTRKTDPAFNMHQFRLDVRDSMKEAMAHEHIPPAGQTHGWADDTWEIWVARSGTNPDTRGWNFQREDLGWVYHRVILPLEERVMALENSYIHLSAQIAELNQRLDAISDTGADLSEINNRLDQAGLRLDALEAFEHDVRNP